MGRAISHFLGFGAVVGMLLATAREASAYTVSDLQGTWESNSIASGPGAPWWDRTRALVAADGGFTAFGSDNTGGADTLSANLLLSSAGVVTVSSSSVFRGALDLGKTIFAGTETWTTDAAGTTELRVALKMAPSYAQSDLTGNWELNIIASGPAAPWWERGRIAVASNGAISGSFTDNSGASDPVSGTLTLSPGGIITRNGAPSARIVLDSSRGIFAGTDTWSGFAAGTAEMSIGLKMAASYTLADLAGTWEFHGVATGPGAPRWTRTHMAIAANGSFTSWTSQSNGTFTSTSGTLAITPAGVITRSGSTSARGVLGAGKTVMVWTSLWTTESPGTTQIEVATKTNTGTADVPGPVLAGLTLEPVRPNPVRGGDLTVHFVLPNELPARIELLDVSGRCVAAREVGPHGPGAHSVSWAEAAKLSPGVYLVHLRQGARSEVRRVAVLR